MPGANTGADTETVIRSVEVTDDEIVARLSDGRTIAVPLAWSWRLSDATVGQRQNFRLIGGGQGVHWPMSMRTSAYGGCFTEALDHDVEIVVS